MSTTNPQSDSAIQYSRGLLMCVVIACTAVVWMKLDSVSRELSDHSHLQPHDRLHQHSVTVEQEGDGTVHQHGPFHAATHPPDGQLSLVPEWAPTRAIAMALPALRIDDAGYLKLLGDLSEVCVERTNADIIVVVQQDHVAARVRFDAIIDQRQLDRSRVHFYETRSLDSIWIRDYGPLFVRREGDQQVFVVDTAYRDVRLEADQGGIGLMAPLRPADDLIPIHFSTLLNVPFIHPGCALNGGDVYADGRGVLYTSDETLHLNTGDREFLSQVFKQYFGIREVRYLRSLPGPTVKHIDMVFKLVSPDICLVGQYDAQHGDAELTSLQRAAASTLDENARYLEELGLRVIRMPMPDIAKITKWDYYGRIFSEVERQQHVAATAAGAETSEDMIHQQLQTQFAYIYRSCLNSILLVSDNVKSGDSTKSLLIVPRYEGRLDQEFEARVASVYREAYGSDIDLTFVDAEPIAHSNGALHCIVSSIPVIPKISSQHR